MLNACRISAAIGAALLTYAAFAQTPASQVEVAPGIALPATGSVAILDGGSAPRLLTLHASEIKTNMHAGSNFARSMVYANQHHAIELPGAHAEQSVSSERPAIYVRMPIEDPELQRGRMTLLRLRTDKDSREVMQFSANVFGGGHKRNLEEVEVAKDDIDGGKWLKITPTKPLVEGEYAVAALPKDKLLMPDVVYDFREAAKK